MPTASRLLAAIFLGIAAYLAAETYKPVLPEGLNTTWLAPIIAGLGVLVGWISMGGGRFERTFGMVFALGVKGAALTVFWAAFVFSARDMYNRSLRNAYDSAIEAILAIADIGWGYVAPMPLISIALILGGGFLAAIASEWAGRHWD